MRRLYGRSTDSTVTSTPLGRQTAKGGGLEVERVLAVLAGGFGGLVWVFWCFFDVLRGGAVWLGGLEVRAS